MNIGKELLKQRIFYWLIAFVAISSVFPGYSLNSQAIIGLIIFWLFYNPFQEKIELLEKNKKVFLALSIPFWMALIGLLYTEDVSPAFRDIELKVPFLIFPLIFSSVKLKKESFHFAMKNFLSGLVAATILTGIKVLYFKLNDLGDYLYYQNFSDFIGKHTTYFSLFVVIAMLFLLHKFFTSKSNRHYYIFIYLCFVGVLYLLSVRISVIGLAAGSLILIIHHLHSKLKYVIIVLVPLLLGSLYLMPNFQKRFEPSQIENSQIDDADFRKLHWQAVVQTIAHNSLLIGNGTRGNRDYLYSKYKDSGLTSAYEEEYNAHNQYLEILLDFGILGLLFFLLMLFYIARLTLKDNYLSFSILCVFVIFMLTESILERQSGIVLFSYMISLILLKETDNKNETTS